MPPLNHGTATTLTVAQTVGWRHLRPPKQEKEALPVPARVSKGARNGVGVGTHLCSSAPP